MKITSFHPIIVSTDREAVINVFEDLGFERRHKKSGINDEDITNVVMKNADGFHVDVVNSDKIPRDFIGIRINVDDFQEAFDFFTERGFINSQGDKITETESSRATMLFSPTGFAINLVQHIKK